MTKLEDGQNLDIVATPNAGYQPGTAVWAVSASANGNDISNEFRIQRYEENELHVTAIRNAPGLCSGVVTLTVDADSDTDAANVEPLTASYPFFYDGPNSTSIDFTATAV